MPSSLTAALNVGSASVSTNQETPDVDVSASSTLASAVATDSVVVAADAAVEQS